LGKHTNVLVGVTTTTSNKHYLDKCIEGVRKCVSGFDHAILIINFGSRNIEKPDGTLGVIHKPNSGFCKNMNLFINAACSMEAEYLFYLNDDAIPHPDFLRNAIEYKDTFVGGTQQKGGWLEQITDKSKPPEPKVGFHRIVDLRKLNWEFSCCVFPANVIKQVGYFDEYFDPTGYIADNDYLLRMKKLGIETIRAEDCTFWHGKGITQIQHRNPLGNDPVRTRALKRFKRKWNLDLESETMITCEDL